MTGMKRRSQQVHSENLTVVFTDIVGFTKTTASQSREANASMLDRHDKLLLPIAKKFGGRRVKSIGDALLLVFRSSTDALLCCMAMQDALFEYNSRRGAVPAIHIRAAVNVGEVRVVRGDVFGEAVNIAARLEGITPADRIYLTNAVQMTMNRAEVPVEEVGVEHFKGIEEAVQVFQVPQFSTTKLVVDHRLQEPEQDGPREGFAYPYGGVHLMDFSADSKNRSRAPRAPWMVITLALALLSLTVWWLWPLKESVTTAGNPQPSMPAPVEHRPRPPVSSQALEVEYAHRPPLAEPEGGLPPPGMQPPPARRRIDVTLEAIAPWLIDQRWFISPVRLKQAPLPLGTPVADNEKLGALPIAWADVPAAEQALLSPVQPDWGKLPPDRQQRLIDTGKLWRQASPAQRRAVGAELDEWQTVAGVDRSIASRRLDYLRALESDKRWGIIEQHGLALSLAGAEAEAEAGAGIGLGQGQASSGLVPEGVEVKPPPPRNIWEGSPRQRPPAPAEPSGGGYGRTTAARRSPPDWGSFPSPPPPPGGFDRRPQRPPGGFDGDRPPPPWDRSDGGRPPFPPPR